jgi:NAD(P)-dependent dehydrogenase (short-subunit alcohol dehydrogenase family)
MDRIIVVTGAASGMGKATADLLRKTGDKVIGLDINKTEGVDIAVDLSTKGGRAQAVAEIISHSPGYIDGAVTWAGIGINNEKTIPVNYFGQIEIFNGIRPLLEKSKTPRIIVTSSRNSLYPPCPQLVDLCLEGKEEDANELVKVILKAFPEGDNTRCAYIASKLAALYWMRRNCCSPEWGGKGILMNAIAPGMIDTPMTKPAMAPGSLREWLIVDHPQAISINQHIIQPEEVAELCRFMLSPGQSILIGQILYMDFGTEAILRGEDVLKVYGKPQVP